MEPKQQALTFGFSFPTLLGLLPTVVLIIALATVGKKKPNQCPSRYIPGLLVLLLLPGISNKEETKGTGGTIGKIPETK